MGDDCTEWGVGVLMVGFDLVTIVVLICKLGLGAELLDFVKGVVVVSGASKVSVDLLFAKVLSLLVDSLEGCFVESCGFDEGVLTTGKGLEG